MNAEEKVRNSLFELQDQQYHDFQCKLIPNISPDKIIGIRTPFLRKFAKSFMHTEEASEFLKIMPHTYYEENNLHMILISIMRDYDQIIAETDRFLPYVDNWATCDLPPSNVLLKHLTELLQKIKEWMASGHTYTIRYGLEMLMRYYLDDPNFKQEYLDMAVSVHSEEYYVKMMIAWFFATALAKQYETTLPYLQQHRLDTWTHNKAIQKALESYRITPEQKEYLRTLKKPAKFSSK